MWDPLLAWKRIIYRPEKVFQVSCTPQREDELWRFTVVLDIVRLSHTVTVITLFYLQGKSRSALHVIIMWSDLIG